MSHTDKDRPYDILMHDRASYPGAHREVFHHHEYYGEPVIRMRAVRGADGKPVTKTIHRTDTVLVRPGIGLKPEFREVTRSYTNIVREPVQVGVFADFCVTDDRALPDGVHSPCSLYVWRYSPGERKSMRAIEKSERATVRQSERTAGRALAHEYNTYGDADSFDNMPDFDSYHTRGVSRWD